MMPRISRCSSLSVVACIVLLSASMADSGAFSTAANERSVADWSARLQALTPSDPRAYFLLAEEVADAAGDDRELALAKHLYALAAVLDPIELGQSACLALADLESEGSQRRRLNALAILLAQRQGRAPLVVESTNGSQIAASPAAVLAISESFSYYRRGDGARALSTLRQAGAIELLEGNESIVPGGSSRFLEDVRRYRGGDTRPTLTERELTNMLRLESALLAGSQRSWSGDLLINHEAPLIEVNPEHLEESLGVDGRRTVYRNGRWVLPTGDD